MSQYTTGEIAKLCAVTVRTVQYYDKRGILTPSALSEGGRRLYSDGDLSRMKVICFLRELGLPLDAIGQLLAEPDPGSVWGARTIYDFGWNVTRWAVEGGIEYGYESSHHTPFSAHHDDVGVTFVPSES